MKVLIAIDGSPCSDAAIKETCRRPWPEGTEVRLLTVVPLCDPNLLGSPSLVDTIHKAERKALLKHLRKACTELSKKAPKLRVTSTQKDGIPKSVIVAEAEQWVDLVIVGSHGYGPIRRFFLGSVSQYVAQHAPCSVEIARLPVAVGKEMLPASS